MFITGETASERNLQGLVRSHLMASTATASVQLRVCIVKMLGMNNLVVISVSPDINHG